MTLKHETKAISRTLKVRIYRYFYVYRFNNVLLTSLIPNYFAVPLMAEALIKLIIMKNSYEVPKSPHFKA